MVRNSIFTFLTTLFLLVLPKPAFSCSCAQRSPCEAFGSATAVFVARMVSGTEKVERTDSNGGRSIKAGTVRFDVEETFKGVIGTEVYLSVSSNKGTSCGPYGLIRGERYLIYAFGSPEKMSTGACTRTNLVPNADEDMTFLRQLPETGSGGRLYGSVWADKKDGHATSLTGVTLIVRGDGGQEFKPRTNDQGEFELAHLKPGKYEVEVVWPEHYESDRSTEEVTVSDRGCTAVGFEGKLNGHLRGTVFDSHRRPASVMLHLLPFDSSDELRAITGFSHQDGSFNIRGIPPGRYLLFFALLSDGWKNNQKYFYPGVKARAEASVIKIGLGEDISDYDFQLPLEYSVQTVEGFVVWPDGSPAAEVEVMLLCPQSPLPQGLNVEFGPPRTRTDERGIFRLQGFKGHSYSIEARAEKAAPSGLTRSELHSPSQQLLLKEDLRNVKLVISEKGFTGGCSEKKSEKK